MTKIVKWELFFIFDDGSRESMWEINRLKGRMLSTYSQQAINTKFSDDFVMVKTYADGRVEE